MNDTERQLAAKAVESILESSGSTPGGAEVVWNELGRAGFLQLGTAGSGTSFADAVAVVVAVSRLRTHAEFAEQVLTVAPALAIADLPAEIDPATVEFLAVGALRATARGGVWVVDGTASGLARGGRGTHCLVLADTAHGPAVLALASDAGSRERSANAAGEPRTAVTYQSTAARAAAQLSLQQARALHSLPAYARAAQSLGLLRAMLDLTLRYARQREQFGRAIATFPAVRSALAGMAGELAALEALVATAAETGPAASAFPTLAAAAKVRASQAIDAICAAAHQVHGAIGLTREYPLADCTARAWAWRDEAGTPSYWAAQLADALVGDAALWPALTRL